MANADLRQHKKDYPEMAAFADIDTPEEDVTKSREERVLEFELEKMINKVRETVDVRQKMYSAPEPNNVLPFVTEVKNILEHRKERETILAEASSIPTPPPVPNTAEQLFKGVAYSAESRNLHPFVVTKLQQFYTDRLTSHPLRRYKLLFRWARFCSSSEESARSSDLLGSRLRALTEDASYCESALERLERGVESLRAEQYQQQEQTENMPTDDYSQEGQKAQPKESAQLLNQDLVRLADFRIWLNQTCYAQRSRRKFSRFALKCKWLCFSKRSELYAPISEAVTGETKRTPIPLMPLSDEDLETALEELTTCFKLRGVSEDSQEYSYSVNKRFTAVFNSQNQAATYSPYELSIQKKSDGRKHTLNTPEASTADCLEEEEAQKVYLVYSMWPKYERKKAPLPPHLEAINLRLNMNQDHMDGVLKVEIEFLNETDTQHVVKRLREQAGAHLERALVRQKAGGDIDRQSSRKPEKVKPAAQGPTGHKKQALYMLRYIRTREFKKRLLDILNYFASIRRKLTLDRYGYLSQGAVKAGLDSDKHVNTADAVVEDTDGGGMDSFTQKLKTFDINLDALGDGHPFFCCLKSDMLKMASVECRDDSYKVTGKSITVLDTHGQAVMYDVALKDLEALEQELLRVGTYYIGKYKATGGSDIDRGTILEDLFECETWFQDSKRKIVDCYMESYEHTTDPHEMRKLGDQILDAISARPALDLHDTYFTAAYTNETIVQELMYSLLRDIINTQITEEKRSITSIHKATGSKDWWSHAGLPHASVSDTKLYQALFPGSSVVNVLDFYASLGVLTDVRELLDYITSNVMNDFSASPAVLNTVKQHALQLMYVEWKVLTEEERVQRQLQNAATNEDTDDRSYLDDATSVEGVIESLLGEVPSKGEAKDEAYQRTLWYDAMEAAILRNSLLESLYETELLYNVHKKQGYIMGVDVRKFQFEAMDFETRKTYAELDDTLEDTDMSEVVALRTEYLTQLAIAEFEHGMAHFDFHSAAGLQRILAHCIPDLRRSLNVQVAQRNMLITATLFNQMPIDMYYLNHTYQKISESSTFVTQGNASGKGKAAAEMLQGTGIEAADMFEKEPRGPDAFPHWLADSLLTYEQLRPLFLSVNNIKSTHRRHTLEELNTRTAEILRSRRPELLRKKMKELKHNLIHGYCLGITTSMLPFTLRWQAARHSNEIRRAVSGLGFDKTLYLGSDKDGLDAVASASNQGKTKGSQWNGTCLLALDGRVENPWYIPHFMQIYTQWNWDKDKRSGFVKSSDAHNSVDMAANLRNVYCLRYAAAHLYHVYCVVVLCVVVSRLACTSNAVNTVNGVKDANKELKKIEAELELLSDPADTRAVTSFMEATYKTMYMKLVLACTTLKHTYLSPANGKPLKQLASVVSAALVQLETATEDCHLVSTCAQNEINPMREAIKLRQDNEAFASDYRSVYRRVELFESEWDVDEPKQVPAHKLQAFDESFYHSIDNGQLWEGAYSLPLSFAQTFLLRLGDDRKALLTEYTTLGTYLSDIKADQAFIDEIMLGKDVADREHDQALGVVKANLMALSLTAEREKLKLFYCAKLEPKQREAVLLQNIEEASYDENFVKMVNSKARSQYEHDLQEQDTELKDTRGRVRRRKRTEVGLRRKQVLILKQEINKHLLHVALVRAKEICEAVNASVVRMMHDTNAPSTAKLDMFNDFHTSVMAKAAHTRQEETDLLIYQIPGPLLSMATDSLGLQLRKWQVAQLKEISETSEQIIQHHRHALFKSEQKVLYLEKMRELDKKALSRRVAARINDEKYLLIFQKNCLQKDNEDLKDSLSRLEAIVREKVKSEYEDEMTRLRNEITLLQGQFKDHKKKLYREMQINLEEIKRHAMMSIGKSEVAPLHMKRQALRIAINDEETNKLKEQIAELQVTVTKLKLWHEMKLSNLEGQFQKKIAALEKEKSEASSKYWGNKEHVEEKEEHMRAQLNATQKSLSATEMEVEQLLRDLDLQERKKKHLVAWKVSHSKQLEELMKKSRRFEKYEKYDIEKLLRCYEKNDDKAKNTTQGTVPALSKFGNEETSRSVTKLRDELKKERRLKTKAFVKINQMREEQDAVTDEMVWQKKYFECASELQRTLRDLQVYKEHLTNLNITHPALARGSDTCSPMSDINKNLPNLSQRDPPRVSTAPGSRPPVRIVPTRPSTSTPTRLHPTLQR